MPTTTRSSAPRGGCCGGGGGNLKLHIVSERGAWSGDQQARQADMLRLSDHGDEVVLRGPLDLNLSVYAEHEMTGASGAVTATRVPIMSHDISIPAASTWRYAYDRLPGTGKASAWIRPAAPRAERPVVTADDLPCDFAVSSLADTGAFFPSPCEPCEGGPIRVPPLDCGPAVDVLPARGGCVRPRYFNGMFITREDLEAEQRYFRLRLRMHNRAAGTGVVWGLGVALRGEHIVVAPGYGVDCCGNDLAITCDYAVPAATLLRDPAVCGRDRDCYALLLEYVECAEDPRPVHGDGCEPQRAGCEMSRIRETARLRLVPPAAVPQTPLGRFLERVDALHDAPETPAVPVAGAGLAPAPDSVAVPFTVITRLGVAVELQPDRSQVVTGVIDPVPPKGMIAVELRPTGTAGALSGQVLPAYGTPVVGIGAAGAAWSVSYDRETTSFMFVAEWSTAQPQALRGRTLIRLAVRPGDEVRGEVVKVGNDAICTRWPDGHGLNPGDEVFVGEPDGVSVATFVLELPGDLVVVKTLPNTEPKPHTTVFFRRPTRLDIAVEPTPIVIEQAPPALPCCGPGCCDGDERPPSGDRPRALLAALLYGRIVQRNRLLGDAARDVRIVATLRKLLDVKAEHLPAFEAAFADLYRAWCAAGLYSGPEHCEHDGVVVGCAHVRAGAICSVDPLAGRRWVVHQPLLDHWAGAFGLDPLDRRVGELFQRLCCLSHLPDFGRIVDLGLPRDGDEPPESLVRFLGGPLAEPDDSAVVRGLMEMTELDAVGIAALVDDVLCADTPRAAVREPLRARTFIAEAFADMPTREQPRQTLRETAREVVAIVLSAVPVEEVVGADHPLASVLDSADVKTLRDVLEVPPDTVAYLAVAVAAAEQVDKGMQEMGAKTEAVVKATAAALKAMADLTEPEQLSETTVARALAKEIATRLKSSGIKLDADVLAKQLAMRGK